MDHMYTSTNVPFSMLTLRYRSEPFRATKITLFSSSVAVGGKRKDGGEGRAKGREGGRVERRVERREGGTEGREEGGRDGG